MHVTATQVDCSEPICLYHWTIADSDAFVGIIAHVAVGRARHALKLLGHEVPPLPAYSDKNIDQAIRMLDARGTGQDEPFRWHRDGWLFQIVSWIASVEAAPGCLVKAPQPRHSEKGFDGMIIEVGGGKVQALTVCEDKATDRPRDTVRDHIWPSFAEIAAGLLDNTITADAETLLNQLVGIDPADLTASPDWYNEKRYRASVITSRSSLPKRAGVFDGYDAVVAGEDGIRGANLCLTDNMRDYLEQLAVKVIGFLERMRPA